jgi:periplasmic protein CpxP/Spy
MKTKFVLITAVLFVAGVATNAQGGGFPRRTVEERLKAVDDKIAVFNLEKSKKDQADTIFTQYFKAVDAKRDEIMGSGSPDREKMRSEMQKLSGDRDDKLKGIFTDDQFKKWKEEIEPSLRPQRPNGGNGKNGSS